MAERFAIERELGRGGMGVVYLARDLLRGERVALKRLGAEADPEALRREFRAALSLRHPVIVRAHELGHDAEGPFLTMEWVDGDDLSHYAGKVEPSRVARWAVLIADALEYARRRGLVHGDIKPQNLLVPRADPDSIKLLDLGLVGRAGERATGGTVAYLAPEVLAGEASDARSDLFSLGCVLFELLSGRPPFEGTARSRPASLADAVPARLREVVRRLHDLRPDARPGRPSDVALLLGDDAPLRLPLPEGDLVGRDEILAAVRAGTTLFLDAPPGMGATRVLQEIVTSREMSGESQPLVFDVGDAAAESELLAATAAGHAVVVARHPAGSATGVRRSAIALRPLLESEVAQMISSRLPLESSGVGMVARRMFQESGGCPALVVEALESLRDSGLLRLGPLGLQLDAYAFSRWQPEYVASGRVDHLLQGLNPEARASGARLAILGSEPVHPALEESLLLSDEATGERRFRSEMIRRALIESLSGNERTRLHGLAAEELLARSATDSARIAEHLLGAGRDREAADWLRDAARQRREEGDRAGALVLLEAAVDRLHGTASAEARMELGAELEVAGRGDEALAQFRTARTTHPEMAPTSWAAEAELLVGRKDRDGARAAAARILEHADSGSAESARGHLVLGRIDAQSGEFIAARDHFLAAGAVYEQREDERGRAKARMAMGNLAFLARRYDESVSEYEHALTSARRLEDKQLLGAILQNLSNVYAYHRRSAERARATVGETVRFAEASREPFRLARALAALSVIEFDSGHLDAALRNIDRAIALDAQLGDESSLASDRLFKAEVLLTTGGFEDAERLLAVVLDFGLSQADEALTVAALDELARVRMERRDFTGARVLLERATEIVGSGSEVAPSLEGSLRSTLASTLIRLGEIEAARVLLQDRKHSADIMLEVRARLSRAEAELLVAMGDSSGAIDKLADPLPELRAAGFAMEIGRALFEIGTIEARRGHYRVAVEALDEARVLFSRQGARPALARAMLLSSKLSLEAHRQLP